jgi:small subunit ribosomal protein S4
MGDPKKLKKKYNTPIHPWNKNAIEQERILSKEYGLTNKKEIFIANSFLKKYKEIAKKLIATKTAQAEKEKKQVMEKLQRYGLLQVGSQLDQILGLETKDVMERRLQSLLFRKGFARSMKQARQFVTHRHVIIGKKQITSPSYMLTLEEESSLTFKPTSQLASADHPERISLVQQKLHEEAETVRKTIKEGNAKESTKEKESAKSSKEEVKA